VVGACETHIAPVSVAPTRNRVKPGVLGILKVRIQTALLKTEIQSVTLADDAQILETLIPMHSPVESPYIVDCTFSDGVMWNGCGYQPDWKIDIRELPGVDAIDDFTKLETVSSADVLVFDPPHLPNAAGSKNSSKLWEHRYGITGDGAGREGDNVSGMFAPFLLTARRVLTKNGVVLAKIADLTHNHRYQWQHIDFVTTAAQLGLTPCDMLIKWGNSGNIKSSKWVNSYHIRKTHSFWLVVRNGPKCERTSRLPNNGIQAKPNLGLNSGTVRQQSLF
jgi:hypothetical protein